MERKFTINEQGVLGTISAYPTRSFSAREIARLLGISHPTVLKVVRHLAQEELVIKQLKKNLSGSKPSVAWKANQQSKKYSAYKRIQNLYELHRSGVIEEIASQTAPNAIILFGSYGRGEDTEESDIDLFVVSREKQLDLRRYEKKLKRKINITFEKNPAALSKEFLNNVVNGIVMYGYFEVPS
ncbi:MAG: nucleotidyltransferase domain-containing protein [Candidatus Woesearchaeota archaeon]|nr:nucleotidyltransferase domain-containing protein [Candidatus Woesearchaeota archaeon]